MRRLHYFFRKAHMNTSTPYVLICLFSIMVINNIAMAELILSAPPRESLEAGHKTYEPIAHYLEQLLGEAVIYEHPSSWMQYSANMRSGKYDIVFDGPHFAAWRIKHMGHVPVARLPGTLTFYVIAKKSDKRLNSISKLKHSRFCGLASPNLGTMTVYSQFESSLIIPEIFEVQGGFKGVYKAFKEGKCRAAIIRDNIYKQLSEAEKKTIKIIFKSEPLPNQTMTVKRDLFIKSSDLSAKLTTRIGAKAGQPIFERFSKKARYFQTPSGDEYKNIENLLETVVWGW